MTIDTTQLASALRQQSIVDLRHLDSRPLTDCFSGTRADTGSAVFVKVLHAQLPDVRRNFLREIACLEAFRGQPGIPALVAASIDPDLLFHVCEAVPGSTLQTVLRHVTEYDLPTLLIFGARLARWLVEFHRRGYAHRDLSPDHVFIHGDGMVTVVDFGLAKDLCAEAPDTAALARGYDIQAVAMILWELICGHSVFHYRGACLPCELAAEAAIVARVLPDDALGQLLVKCLAMQSEVTPDGQGSDPVILVADDLAAALAAFA